jgi:hypothetical protein
LRFSLLILIGSKRDASQCKCGQDSDSVTMIHDGFLQRKENA